MKINIYYEFEFVKINDEREYLQALELVDAFFDNPPSIESKEGKKLKQLLLMVKHYEDKFYPIPLPYSKNSSR